MATDEVLAPMCVKRKGGQGVLGPDLSALLERLDFPVLEGSIATVPLICTTVPPIRRCIIPQGIVTFPRSSRGLRTLWLFHINCAFRLAFNDSRLRLLCPTFDFGEGRSLPMMREQSRRHLAKDRGRRRLIGSQAEIGGVMRLQECIEPKGEQTKSNYVRREGDTNRRSRSVYTITGHKALHLLAPDDPVARTIAAGEFATIGEYPECRLKSSPANYGHRPS